MASGDTKAMIAETATRFMGEVPALKQLKLVVRLELQARGGDAPIWRVEVPGPKIDRHPAGDARVDVLIQRQAFNELAKEATLRDWVDAYERGQVRVSGDQAVIKLIGNVIARQRARAPR